VSIQDDEQQQYKSFVPEEQPGAANYNRNKLPINNAAITLIGSDPNAKIHFKEDIKNIPPKVEDVSPLSKRKSETLMGGITEYNNKPKTMVLHNDKLIAFGAETVIGAVDKNQILRFKKVSNASNEQIEGKIIKKQRKMSRKKKKK